MTDLLLESLVTPSSTSEQTEFLKSKLEQADLKSVVVDDGNGTTNYGRIAAGTIMGKITSGGRYRPCAKTVGSTSGASVTITVTDSSNFRVGDAIYDDGADTGETVSAIPDSTTLTASGSVTIAASSVVGVGDGSDTAVGILLRDINTLSGFDAAGSAQYADTPGILVITGRVDESKLTGDSTNTASDLAGITMD